MKPSACCHSAGKGRISTPASPLRRGAEIAGALTSAVTLLAMPKCPMCLAAYLALATGIGISVPAASQLRFAVLAASCTLLILFVVRSLARIALGENPRVHRS